MENLELLKQDWKKEKQLQNFSKEEIYRMIKKNSISISKTLLWIGILEVCFWIFFFYMDAESLDSFLDLKLFFRTVLFIFFIFMIIFSYFKINNEVNSRKLMKQILNLRKMVFVYIVIMIVSIIIFNIIDFKDSASDVIRGYINGYNSAHGNMNDTQNLNINNVNPWAGYIGFGITFIISIALLLLIYKIVYGSLLRKLKENYKELIKIESDN